jgi:hypothetical protein
MEMAWAMLAIILILGLLVLLILAGADLLVSSVSSEEQGRMGLQRPR